MGGNALKDVGVVRLPARLYARLAEQVVARLTDGVLFPGLHGAGPGHSRVAREAGFRRPGHTCNPSGPRMGLERARASAYQRRFSDHTPGPKRSRGVF